MQLVRELYDTKRRKFRRWSPYLRPSPRFETSPVPVMNHFCFAAFNGHHVVLQTFLTENKGGMDIPDEGGLTALIWASANGHDKAVQTLIHAGAEINAQGGRYGNALQAASRQRHKEIVRILIDAEADINAQGGFYGNALQAAVSGGCKELVRMLIDAGADINAKGGRYGSALQAAIHGNHMEVAQMLIWAGADINALDELYTDFMQVALEMNRKKAKRVDPGLYGNELRVASKSDQVEAIQTLMDAVPDMRGLLMNYDKEEIMARVRGNRKELSI